MAEQELAAAVNTSDTYIILPWRNIRQWAKASSLSRIHDHTQTHHALWDSSEWVISPTQRPLRGITQESQETGIHAPGGIRTHNPSNRAAADQAVTGTGDI